MVTIVLVVLISFFLTFGTIALGQAFANKSFKSNRGTPSVLEAAPTRGAAKKVKKVRWDSGNPGSHNVVSEGNDLTELLVSLGAPALPLGARYVFFKSLALRHRDFSYTTLTHKFENVLTVIMDGKLIGKRSVAVTDSPEEEMLLTAEILSSNFQDEFNKVLRKRKFEEFVEGNAKPEKTNSLHVIGEPTKWVED